MSVTVVEVSNGTQFSLQITSNPVQTIEVVSMGPKGAGVPEGGVAGQVVRKTNSDQFITEWHTLTKADIGLGNADNTSDVDKPVSTAQAAAIKVVQDDVNAHEARIDNPHAVTKAQVGLGNADNTSDANKPISTAQQAALDLKAPKADPTLTGAVIVDGANSLKLKPAAADHVYLEMYPRSASPGTRGSYIGFPAAGTTALDIANEVSGDTRFLTGGAERLRITSGGNVGIGTAAPSGKLHVSGGPAYFYGSGNAPIIWGNTSGVGHLSYGTNQAIIRAEANNALAFQTNGPYERMQITTAGDVMIGTTTGSGAKLHVNGAGYFAGSVTVGHGGLYQSGSIYSDSNWGMIFRARHAAPANAHFRWAKSDDAEVMRIDTSGRLGVGATAPTRKLSVYDAGSSMVADFRSASGNNSFISFSNNASTADQVRIGSTEGNLVLSTNYTERLRIAADGNIGIGMAPSGYGLHQLGGGIKLQGVAVPAPSVANAGTTGTTTYDYWVWSIDRNGKRTPISAKATTTTGNAVLDATNYNTISWAAVPGAVKYGVLRNGWNSIGETTATSLKDTGQAATAVTPWYINETADVSIDGRVGLGTGSSAPAAKLHVVGSTLLHGNVGIGTSSSELRFHVRTDGAGLGTVGRFERVNGTDTYSLNINVDPDSDVVELRAGGTQNGSLSLATNNTERMRITAAGNVGIGTSSPSGPLHVANTAGDANTWIQSADGSLSQIIFSDSGGYAGKLSYRHSSESMEFYTAMAERMRITSGGNVLVGTTADAGGNYKLQVAGSGKFGGTGKAVILEGSGYAQFLGDNYSAIFGTIGAYNAHFYTGGAERMRIAANGRVLIGTTYDDGSLLHVAGIVSASSATYTNFQVRSDRAAAGDALGDIRFIGKDSVGNYTGYASVIGGIDSPTDLSEGGHLRFHVTKGGASAEAVRINQHGYMLFNGNAVISTQAASSNMYLGGGSIQPTQLWLEASSFVAAKINGAERMRITSNGNVLVGTATDSGAKLHVEGPVRATGNTRVECLAGLGVVTDFNLPTTSTGGGIVPIYSGFQAANRPGNGTNYHTGFHFRHNLAEDYATQMVTAATGNTPMLSLRSKVNGTFADWHEAVLQTSGGPATVNSGIRFPATQVASTEANTLDDYEEGTFTPTIVGTTAAGVGTYGAQVGRYTKIGNRVIVQIRIIWSAHDGTGKMRISGLPFVALNASNVRSAFAIMPENIAMPTGSYMQALTIGGMTQLELWAIATGTSAPVTVDMDSAGNITLTGSYEV